MPGVARKIQDSNLRPFGPVYSQVCPLQPPLFLVDHVNISQTLLDVVSLSVLFIVSFRLPSSKGCDAPSYFPYGNHAWFPRHSIT